MITEAVVKQSISNTLSLINYNTNEVIFSGGWEVITEAFINANQFKMNQTITKERHDGHSKKCI